MREIRIVLLIALAVSIVGCSKFRKIQKSGDWKTKYDAALEYYEEEDYHRTTLLLEDILPIIRGTEEAELGNFYLSYSYFHQKQYILSAHHFNEFVKIYGRSEYALEATYMHAYSLYLQ
ncbi:MAG: outer membrane protein assembly factor BamD, partial [Ekhidna sp.]|nr:outer membrane protein assembly factor BamD [Ekhidna sp.]